MYYLRLLGSLSLEKSPGAAAVSLRPRPLAVLAFLAVAGDKGCSRDKLIGYFWPEVEPERARHRLTDAVYLIHKSLGSGSVAAVSDSLCLNRDVVESDLARFLGALHSERHIL